MKPARPVIPPDKLAQLEQQVYDTQTTRRAFYAYRRVVIKITAAAKAGDSYTYRQLNRELENERKRLERTIDKNKKRGAHISMRS